MAAVMKTSGLAGLLTGAVALGIAELTAAVTGPNGAPVTAVGETAINLTPVPVKEFAIAHFGTHDKAALKKLLANKAELTKILTYQVAPARYTPTQLASGTVIKTLEGGMVTPAAMGSTYEVNKANVVCGKVQTANATVYIIDTVLTPPAK
jgi:Fasciclin domain